jgi:Fe-S-cluster containining protein
MSRTKEEIELICQSAENNDHQCTPGHLACDQPRCPLLKVDGGCNVHPVRPRYCRQAEHYEAFYHGSGHDMTCVAEDFGPERPDSGIRETRYELNSALAVALSEPEGEQPWQPGPQLFANCRRVS